MGIYDKFADTPDRINLEGQEITLKFKRNGDGTGTITWNLPTIAGCAPEDLVYDGIIITVSDRPANYISSSPSDGEYYDADPTLDANAHTGDSINVARVIGAFYHDKTTTSLTVTDVLDKTAYYISGYAVDQVANYHREGVHAYSLPTGAKETDKQIGETPAYHDVGIDTPEGVTPKTRTGLDRSRTYKIRVDVNDECLNFNDIQGSEAQTYEDLAAAINKRFALASDPIVGNDYPNAGVYYVDVENEVVSLWDGESSTLQTSIFAEDDPAFPVLGVYWYKPSTGELKIRETSGWAVVTAVIDYPTDPSKPADGTIWLDKVLDSNGDIDASQSVAWVWEGNTWCRRPTYIQTRNPLLAPILTINDYWYNSTSGETFVRNVDLRRWDEVDPIVWESDPNTINNGDFWYDLTNEIVNGRISGEWSELTNIRYEERNASGELDNPVALHYWFIPSEQLLFQRDSSNTTWVELDVILAASDPSVRASCDLWWDITASVDSLFKWDDVNNVWKEVDNFFQQETDPALPPKLENESIWYDPETGIMQRITGINCSDVIFICTQYDPTNLPVGVVWRDSDGNFYIWDGTQFVSISTVFVSEGDPYGVADGVVWYDTNDDTLYLRDSGAWTEPSFSLTPLAPEKGTLFFNTITDELLEWNGSEWIEGEAIAQVKVEFNREVCIDEPPDVNTDLFSPFNDIDEFGRDLLRFCTRLKGCEASIKVDNNSRSILTEINKPIVWYSPMTGRSIGENGPTYREIGAGTDGSPDERRALQDQIRVALGSVGTTVELTKQQLDECINNALLQIRKYSSYAYERTLFFLDVFPNQQRYLLTNKCVGFNKIVSINECMRMRTGFLGASHGTFGGYDIYGYAALQQLYSTGTFDMLSYHLVSSYIEDLQYLFADQLVYTWYEDTRVMSFHQVFYAHERILMDATIEVPEQRLITHRQLAYWIKKWAIAEAKMILSQVRGKFQTLPGPNGSTTLNSQELITQAENEKVELREELMDRSMQDENVGVKSQFLIG